MKVTDIFEGDVIKFPGKEPNGKIPAGAKEISMMAAFGSKEMNALHDAGISLSEKPSYWEDFEGDGFAAKRNIDELKLKKVEKLIGKIKEYSGQDVYGTDVKPRGPQVKVLKMPLENMCIIKFNDGTKYLVDTTQANTYIRMWQKINPKVNESTDDEYIGWYIVKNDDTIGAGPFDTRSEATSRTRQVKWYNPSEYSIEYGTTDENDKFKDLPRP